MFLFLLSVSKSNSSLSVFVTVCIGRPLLMMVSLTRIVKQCGHKAHQMTALLDDGMLPLPLFSKDHRSLSETQATNSQTGQQRTKIWCIAVTHQGQGWLMLWWGGYASFLHSRTRTSCCQAVKSVTDLPE